jgi:carboxymethylenebutenolidase
MNWLGDGAMCDTETLAHDEAKAREQGVSRRAFSTMTAMGAAVAMAHAQEAIAAGPALSETAVTIKTPDGACDAFLIHPAKGKHPGVIMWPDIAGLRDAYKVMARRLAGEGYAVLLVNHYYRGGKAPFLATMSEWRTPAGQEKLKPLIAGITPAVTTSDAKAFVAFLDAQKAVDTKRKIGSNGYCMGGPYTVRTAAAVPARVGAACSFHGGGLVGDGADSPVKLIAATNAMFLFAIAQNDDARAPTEKVALRDAAAAAKRSAEVEVYKADHGWCTLDAPSYNKDEAERAWGRMLALYAQL